jgi:hypothetical protein
VPSELRRGWDGLAPGLLLLDAPLRSQLRTLIPLAAPKSLRLLLARGWEAMEYHFNQVYQVGDMWDQLRPHPLILVPRRVHGPSPATRPLRPPPRLPS